MRNLVLLLSVLILGTSGAMAAGTTKDKVAERNAYRYNDAFIFVENGITFSVYPDGEFDFYIENRVRGRRNGVTFNSGFDYSPFAQYDDYGAVIQVENVPIFYDFYGRVNQIGDVDISYFNGRVRRLGGMNVFYNRRGFYDYHTGYINVFNRNYAYRPFHGFFVRPSLGFCLVFNRPYRRFYSPVRYTYHRPYRHNQRRSFARIGKTHRYNKVRRERAKVYRNDQRVAVRERNARTNRAATKRGNATVRNNRAIAGRSNAATNARNRNASRNTAIRSNGTKRKVATTRTSVDRTRQIRKSDYNLGTRSSSKGNVKGRTVTKRSTSVSSPKRNEVTRRTVTRSTKTYKAPKARSTNRSVRQHTSTPSRNSMSTRNSSQRRTVSKAPSRSRVSSARRSSTSRTVSKAPSRSSRNTANRSSRSSRRY